MEADADSVGVHGKGDPGAKPRGEVIAEILASIKSGALDAAKQILSLR